MEKKNAYYMGRLLTTKGKLAYFWLFDGEEKPRGYTKQLAPSQIGEQWHFSVGEKNMVYTAGEHRPTQTGAFAPDDKRLFWEARSRAQEQQHSDNKAAAKLKKRQSEFDHALEPIKKMLDTIKYHDDRTHFINAVTSELWRR